MKLTTTALLLLLIAGCEPSGTSDIGLPMDDGLVVRSYLAPEDRPTTPAEREALGIASRDALTATREVFQTSTTWVEADARVRQLLADETDPVRHRFLEETSATRMLEPGVLDDSDAALDVLGRHVEVLIRYDNQDTPRIAGALQRLEGHWAPDRLAHLAAEAAADAEAYVARKADCEGCSPERISSVLAVAVREGSAQFDGRFADAYATLRSLAGEAE